MIPQVFAKALNTALREVLRGEVLTVVYDEGGIEATIKADGRLLTLRLVEEKPQFDVGPPIPPPHVTDRTPPPETEPLKKKFIDPFRVARSKAEIPAELREPSAAADAEIQAHLEPRPATALAVVPDNSPSSTEDAHRLITLVLRRPERYSVEAVCAMTALLQLEHPPGSMTELEEALGAARAGELRQLLAVLEARRAQASARCVQ